MNIVTLFYFTLIPYLKVQCFVIGECFPPSTIQLNYPFSEVGTALRLKSPLSSPPLPDLHPHFDSVSVVLRAMSVLNSPLVALWFLVATILVTWVNIFLRKSK